MKYIEPPSRPRKKLPPPQEPVSDGRGPGFYIGLALFVFILLVVARFLGE